MLGRTYLDRVRFIQVPAGLMPADTDIILEKPPSPVDTAREPRHHLAEVSTGCKLVRMDNLSYSSLKGEFI